MKKAPKINMKAWNQYSCMQKTGSSVEGQRSLNLQIKAFSFYSSKRSITPFEFIFSSRISFHISTVKSRFHLCPFSSISIVSCSCLSEKWKKYSSKHFQQFNIVAIILCIICCCLNLHLCLSYCLLAYWCSILFMITTIV